MGGVIGASDNIRSTNNIVTMHVCAPWWLKELHMVITYDVIKATHLGLLWAALRF